MTTVIDTVRVAYAAGLCLLPTREDGSKAPAVPSWKTYQQTRPTRDTMTTFDFAHCSGFGMIAGPVSGHREAWDIDCPDTATAFVAAAEACGLGEVLARIRAGYEDVTPGGGVRWIVTYPADVVWKDCTLAKRPKRPDEKRHERDDWQTLVELPTFSILAPSNGTTHPSGRPYVRRSGGFDTIASYAAEQRDALIALARSFDQSPRREAAPRTSPATDRPAGNRPGDDFNRRMTWTQLLEPAGWTRIGDRGEVTLWRRPGKDFGPSATTNIGGSDLFYPFTSSTAFEQEKSYSKFSAYTTLEHAGDFSKAALALAKQGYGQQDAPPSASQVTATGDLSGPRLTRLSDVTVESIDWLWHSRFARGKYTLLAGDPGQGKSRITFDTAARITTGSPWPDGGAAPLGNVLFLVAEDGLADTVRPAIEAMGGDVSRVYVLEGVIDGDTTRVINLARDLATVDAAIREVQPELVVIDPITAYLGKTDSYKDAEVRGLLATVARHRAALCCVAHLAKDQQRAALHRPGGSVAFVAAARVVFALAADPQDADRRVLVPLKSNICRPAPALAFRMPEGRPVWETGPVLLDADTLLRSARPEDRADASDAERVVRNLLEDALVWPLDAKQAIAAGHAHGVHERSLQRAARGLGIKVQKSVSGTRGNGSGVARP